MRIEGISDQGMKRIARSVLGQEGPDSEDYSATEDYAMMECPKCGTSVRGDPSKYGETHAEFRCPFCSHYWLGNISD